MTDPVQDSVTPSVPDDGMRPKELAGSFEALSARIEQIGPVARQTQDALDRLTAAAAPVRQLAADLSNIIAGPSPRLNQQIRDTEQENSRQAGLLGAAAREMAAARRHLLAMAKADDLVRREALPDRANLQAFHEATHEVAAGGQANFTDIRQWVDASLKRWCPQSTATGPVQADFLASMLPDIDAESGRRNRPSGRPRKKAR